MRLTRSLTAIVLAALAAGCSGNSPQIGNGVPGNQNGGANGAAFGTSSKGATTAATGFNPFDDQVTTSSAARQVIKNPTLADVMQPGPLPEMAQGKPSAPITIVQYASLTCPHCRHFHETTYPQFKREFIDTGKVRYILREFPIGKQSGNATIALRCAKPEKYFELYGRFMKQQKNWVSQEVRLEPIYAVAKQVGLTEQQWQACLKDEKLINALKAIKDRGRTLGIIGTPNYFVGNTLIKKELTLADIRAIAAGQPPAAVAAR